MLDPEPIYQAVLAQRWDVVLDVLHRHGAAAAGEAPVGHAVEVGVAALLAAFAEAPAAHAGAAEKLFLLHAGGFHALPPERFAALVAGLVRHHAGRPEAALGYARHCPDHPDCAALLAAHAPPTPSVQRDGLDAAVRAPLSAADHTVGLFKSRQEEAFFQAVRDVFATFFVYPNVALSALVDYDAVRDGLTPDERAYFFRGLVDCVVFDPEGGFRPRWFFEVDSPLHDVPERQVNDRRKERILALAGQRLWRVRPRGRADRAAFAALVRALVRQAAAE